MSLFQKKKTKNGHLEAYNCNNLLVKQEPQTSTPVKIDFSEDMTRESSSDEKSQKSTRFLGNQAVAILQKWFSINKEYPYPDEATTDALAREANISCKQVKKWFANKRVRSQLCCKPIHRNVHKKNKSIQEPKQSSMAPATLPIVQHTSSPVTIIQQQQQAINNPYLRHLSTMNPAALAFHHFITQQQQQQQRHIQLNNHHQQSIHSHSNQHLLIQYHRHLLMQQQQQHHHLRMQQSQSHKSLAKLEVKEDDEHEQVSECDTSVKSEIEEEHEKEEEEMLKNKENCKTTSVNGGSSRGGGGGGGDGSSGTPDQSSSGVYSTCNETSFNQLKSNLTYSSPISSTNTSSCSSSKSNTPQTQINTATQQVTSENTTKLAVRPLKKINFACISSLVD